MSLQKGDTKRDEDRYLYWRWGDDGEMHLYKPGDLAGYGRAKHQAKLDGLREQLADDDT